MPIQRPSLRKTLLQIQLNRFYDKPIARVSLTLILSLLCIGFFAIAAIKPTLETMAQLIRNIEQQKEIDQKLTQKITALTVAQRELSQKESSFAVLDTAIPSTPKYNELLTALEKIASERQVVFVSAIAQEVPIEKTSIPISLQSSADVPLELESFPLTLSFSGEYESLIGILEDLQNLRRVLLIDRFDMNPSQQQEASNILSLNVFVRAFGFTQSKGVPTPITP